MQCPSSSIRSCILTLAGNSVRGRKRSERPRVLTQESRGANRPGFSNIYSQNQLVGRKVPQRESSSTYFTAMENAQNALLTRAPSHVMHCAAIVLLTTAASKSLQSLHFFPISRKLISISELSLYIHAILDLEIQTALQGKLWFTKKHHI